MPLDLLKKAEAAAKIERRRLADFFRLAIEDRALATLKKGKS